MVRLTEHLSAKNANLNYISALCTFGTPSLVTNYRNQSAACLKLTLT